MDPHISWQTFSTTYWLTRPEIISRLLTRVVGGMCNSQIATDLDASPSAIDRQIYRLGRYCQLFHLEKMKARPKFHAIAFDGFVTFEHSQYHPYHIHLAVDKETAFIPYFTDSEVRCRDVHGLLEMVTANSSGMILHGDDHRNYPRCCSGYVQDG